MLTLLNESLWGDEGFSALAVMKPFGEMLGVVMRDTAPPGFYVVGYLWTRMFGSGEIALRSLSLLLMIGAAIFAGLIVKEITKNKWQAGLVGLLAFLSPFTFTFAFEWRMYALLTFATLGSIYFFIARKWKWYVVMTVLALYTHHLALFTVAVQGLWFLVDELDESGKWTKKKIIKAIKHIWPFWLVVLLYIPWLYPMYLQTTRVQGAGFWLKPPKMVEVIGLMGRFLTGGVDKQSQLLAGGLVLVLLIGKKWKKVGKRWLEVFLMVIAPVVFSVIVSYLVTPVFYDRYLLSVVVGIAALIGMGTRKWLVPVMIILVVIYGMGSYQKFVNPKKRPFREMVQEVKSKLQEGDYLLNYNGSAHHIWETKYYGIGAPIYVPEGELPLYVGTAQMTDEDTVKRVPEETKRLVVITSEPVEKVEIEEPWQVEEVTDFGSIRAIWMEKE